MFDVGLVHITERLSVASPHNATLPRASCFLQVESNDLATRLSIAPWHFGILSALMRLFDMFVHPEDPFPEEKAGLLRTMVLRYKH